MFWGDNFIILFWIGMGAKDIPVYLFESMVAREE